MDTSRLNELKKNATEVRRGVIEAVYSASSGHPGGSLSVADILTYLYFVEMRIDPENPKWEERDRLVLSKGHTSPGLYSVLAQRGYFPKEDLKMFRQVNSHLQGHPDMKGTPGVDMTTGSLGLGFSAACGMALSAKLKNADYRTYAILGDGESQEGQIWEAAMFAAHYKLDNLCAVLDFNGLQIDGPVVEIMNPTPLDEKFAAFGWHVITCCAHDFEQLERAFNEAKTIKGKPTIIIANSIKGKCISYMENQASWHGTAPNAEQYARAITELDAL